MVILKQLCPLQIIPFCQINISNRGSRDLAFFCCRQRGGVLQLRWKSDVYRTFRLLGLITVIISNATNVHWLTFQASWNDIPHQIWRFASSHQKSLQEHVFGMHNQGRPSPWRTHNQDRGRLWGRLSKWAVWKSQTPRDGFLELSFLSKNRISVLKRLTLR